MSWSGQGGFERRGYHHGNLREALVEAALTLIAEKGPAGFTIAEAARLAGVSPGAPYRHFRDAEALLAEVALRGFERFAAVLAAAWNNGLPDACARSRRSVAPTSRLRATNQPTTRRCSRRASPSTPSRPARRRRPRLRHPARGSGASDCGPAAGQRPPSLMVALHVWALSHGIASLFVRADPSRRKLPMSPEDLLEAGVLIYLQSLGLAGGRESGA